MIEQKEIVSYSKEIGFILKPYSSPVFYKWDFFLNIFQQLGSCLIFSAAVGLSHVTFPSFLNLALPVMKPETDLILMLSMFSVCLLFILQKTFKPVVLLSHVMTGLTTYALLFVNSICFLHVCEHCNCLGYWETQGSQ